MAMPAPSRYQSFVMNVRKASDANIANEQTTSQKRKPFESNRSRNVSRSTSSAAA